MVEELLKPIKKEDHKLALDGKSDNAASTFKKAPVSGGCRIEGYVRAKKVKMSNVQFYAMFDDCFLVSFSFLRMVPMFILYCMFSGSWRTCNLSSFRSSFIRCFSNEHVTYCYPSIIWYNGFRKVVD